MVRSHHLAKSICDAGWAAFRTILEGKAADAGRRVVIVPPAFTSQDYSGCRERVPKSLAIRTHVCTTCGLMLDRDENAASNMQWAGQALRGLAGMPAGLNREAPAFRHGEHVTPRRSPLRASRRHWRRGCCRGS